MNSRKPEIKTVAEHLAWAYANVARADAALSKGCTSYKTVHHMIRAKLFHGLRNGTMSMRSLYDDERIKMKVPQACYYCGDTNNLTVDHLIPRIKGGPNEADNLIWACRSCNSSKGGHDMLAWMRKKGTFPAILLLRRYLKLVTRYCDDQELLTMPLSNVHEVELPFDLALIPHKFPPLPELVLWVYPEETGLSPI